MDKDNQQQLFDEITNIAQGYMIAAAIYIDTRPTSTYKKRHRLMDLNVYFDTTFLLYALNYKDQVQKESADVLLSLLRNNGANLYVLPQHFTEIKEILHSFRARDAYRLDSFHTLERLDAEGYTSIELEAIIRNLESELGNLGITVAKNLSYVDKDGNILPNRKVYIDYQGLQQHLIKKIPQYGLHPVMLNNDIDALGAIHIERFGLIYDEIESCPAIFVTTNYALVRECNRYLKFPVYDMHINPIISDTDLTTILWIKYSTYGKEVPRIKLVECARAATSLSYSIFREFANITQRMVRDNKLTEDEAANLRYSAFARAEIAAICGGDVSALDDTSVLAVRDRVKMQYSQEAVEQISDSQEAERLARKAEVRANARLQNTKAKIQLAIVDIRKAVDRSATKVAQKKAKRVTYIAKIFLCILTLASVIISVITSIEGTISVLSILATLISGVSTFLMWWPAIKWGDKLHSRLFGNYFDLEYDKQMKISQPQIDELEKLLAD